MMLEALRQQLLAVGQLELAVRVRPGAAQCRFVSAMADGSLKIDVAAPAEAGRANAALVRFLAESFDVPEAHVEVLVGKTSRRKRVRIRRMQ